MCEPIVYCMVSPTNKRKKECDNIAQNKSLYMYTRVALQIVYGEVYLELFQRKVGVYMLDRCLVCGIIDR